MNLMNNVWFAVVMAFMAGMNLIILGDLMFGGGRPAKRIRIAVAALAFGASSVTSFNNVTIIKSRIVPPRSLWTDPNTLPSDGTIYEIPIPEPVPTPTPTGSRT